MDANEPERVDVEVKTTFLERTVEGLSEVVVEQGKTIEALERRLARLEALAKAAGGTGQDEAFELGDPLEERPPHY